MAMNESDAQSIVETLAALFPGQISKETADEWAFNLATGPYTALEMSDAAREVSMSRGGRISLADLVRAAQQLREHDQRKLAAKRSNQKALTERKDPVFPRAASELQEWIQEHIKANRKAAQDNGIEHPPIEAPTDEAIEAKWRQIVDRMRRDPELGKNSPMTGMVAMMVRRGQE